MKIKHIANVKEFVSSLFLLTAGAVIAAFSLEEFLLPNYIFDGGVTGISMILTKFIHVPLGVLVVVINIPFLIAGFKKMGKEFVIKISYAILVFSFMTIFFEPFPKITADIILAVTFGGVVLGAGVGLVLRGGGCLDGTEVIGIIVNQKYSISVGKIVLLFNVLIYFAAGFIFGMDKGMYSLLMYFITSKVIDIVEIGWDNKKSVMIITDDGKELAGLIHSKLGRTVTFMHGEGYISSDTKDIIYCVVTRAEIFELKRLIDAVEGSTFTTISEVSDIVGTHYKS